MNPERQPYGTQDAEGENPEALMERVNANAAQGMTGDGSHAADPGQAGDGQAARLLEENGFQWLGGQLRDMYEEVVHEPLPGQFLDLLQKLDERGQEAVATTRPAEGSVDAPREGMREEKH